MRRMPLECTPGGSDPKPGGGYRAPGMKYETGSGDDCFLYDMVIFGPQLGITLRF